MRLTTLSCALTLLVIHALETTTIKTMTLRSPTLSKILIKAQVIGVLSYCIYVVHEPIYLFFRHRAPENLTLPQVLEYFPFLLGLVMVCAYTLYSLIERRFDRLKS